MATPYHNGLPSVETGAGVAHEVPLNYFLKHILPSIRSDIDPENVLAKMKRMRRRGRRPITRQGRWRGFAEDPVDTERPEHVCLARFADMVNAIGRAGSPKDAHPSFTLARQRAGDPPLDSEGSTLPSTYLTRLGDCSCQQEWSSMHVLGWFKKDEQEDDCEETYTLMMQGMRRSMQDMRRRFVFGFTVENSRMELWFCDRTQILFSSTIDWITDHLPIVHFFSALLFAEPSQLGWDTTVALTKSPSGDDQYDITVEDADGLRTVYRTLELLSCTRGELEMGKGTRIWKAIELRNGAARGRPVILKDVWRHEELGREGDNLEAIRRLGPTSTTSHLLSRSLLTVLHHGDVVIRSDSGQNPHIDRTRLHTENVARFLRGDPLVDPRFASPKLRVEPHFIPDDGRRMLLGSRIHYRIVFKEICSAIHKQPLGAVFESLGDICEVIQLMHENGWVHRDLSYGNILVDALGHTRLIDFEYAKRARDQAVPEFRVGTSCFMAAEVDEEGHLFRPKQLAPPFSVPQQQTEQHHLLDEEYFKRLFEDCLNAPESSQPPFDYSPLHDLESLWWLIAFYVFEWALREIPEDPKGQREETRIAKLRTYAHKLFNDMSEREKAISDRRRFASIITCLRGNVRRAGQALEEWRKELVARYADTEKNTQAVACPNFAGLHASLGNTIRTIRGLLPVAESEVACSKLRKRSRVEETYLPTKNASPPKKRRT